VENLIANKSIKYNRTQALELFSKDYDKSSQLIAFALDVGDKKYFFQKNDLSIFHEFLSKE